MSRLFAGALAALLLLILAAPASATGKLKITRRLSSRQIGNRPR